MPTYQYACTACDHRFDAVQAFSDDALTVCPQCEGRLRKVFSSVGIVFKGSGFYRTDSRSGAVNGSGSDSGKSESGSDSGTSESTKSESGKSESGKSDSGKSESGRSDAAKSGSSSGSKSGSGSGGSSSGSSSTSGSPAAAKS